MIKCIRCGSEVKVYAKFCNKCGAKITHVTLTPELTAQIDIIRKKIEKDSLNPKLYVDLGLMCLQNNFLQEALIEFQKAVSIDSSNYEAHLRSGEIYLDLEELDKAESSYQKAFSLNPTSPEVKLGLFRVYHLRRKVEQGLMLGEELIQADPNNLEVHKALKEMYNEKGMSEEVFRELLSITALAPHDKESLEELAGFYEERGDMENEIQCYQKVLELDPEDIVSRFSLGKSFCLRGEYEKAIEYLKNIVAEMAHPFESYGHMYLALSYASQQELDNAIQEIGLTSPLDYEELTDTDKKLLAETHYKIGCGILQRKLFYSAIDYLQKAIKYEPQNTEYQKKLDNVRMELTRAKGEVRKKWLVFSIGIVIVAIIVIAGWYLSDRRTRVSIAPAKLIPVYGSLRVNSEPSGADVYVDGKLLGKTPLMVNEISASEHQLSIAKLDRETIKRAIEVKRGETLEVSVVLREEQASITLFVSARHPFPVGLTTPRGYLSLSANDEDKHRPQGAWSDNSGEYVVSISYQPDGAIHLEAKGNIVWMDYRGIHKECNADGTPRNEWPLNDPSYDFAPQKYICPEANPGALVGELNGRCFLIGKSKVISLSEY
ncbi:MAG TPA: PEGA domain-containing protein [candidate division Zixibacteria bacterium]